MSKFNRLAVLNTIIETGLVPVFYHQDVEVAKKIVAACMAGGARVAESTNRGEFAPQVFSELSQYYAKADPKVGADFKTVFLRQADPAGNQVHLLWRHP